jgi:hypothetical protein
MPLMLLALFAMGVHSTFFGPIKYAILPSTLRRKSSPALAWSGRNISRSARHDAGRLCQRRGGRPARVRNGADWLCDQPPDTRRAPLIPEDHRNFQSGQPCSDGSVLSGDRRGADASGLYLLDRRLVRQIGEPHDTPARSVLCDLAISFFWTIGAVLFISSAAGQERAVRQQGSRQPVLVIFSVGVATGSVAINALLRGDVSARYAPISVLAMGAFVAVFWFLCHEWSADVTSTGLMNIGQFLASRSLRSW